MTEQEIKAYIKQNFPCENESCDWKNYANLKNTLCGHEGDDVVSYVSALSNVNGGALVIGVEDKTLDIVGIQDFANYTPESAKYRIVEKCQMFQKQKIRFFPMPEYDLSNNLVKVEIIGKVVDEEFAKLLTKNPQLSLSDILLLDKVQKRKVLNDDEIAYLRKKGFIEGRKPNFFLSENVVKPIDNKKLKADYIKNRNFDDSHYKDMILNYIKKYKKASKSDIGNLIVDKLSPVLSDKQKQSKVSNLLSSLRIDGKIECVNRFWVIKKN